MDRRSDRHSIRRRFGMSGKGGPNDRLTTRALAERALQAIATAQVLRLDYERAQGRLADAIEWKEQLRTEYGALTKELRVRVASLAQEERAAGHSAADLLELLREMVHVISLDRVKKRELEIDVLEWGIREFYAA